MRLLAFAKWALQVNVITLDGWMNLPVEIAEQISAAIEALDSSRGLPDRVGRELSAIPLLADIGGAVLLRADGVFLELEWDQETEVHPREVAEPSSTVPLVAGTERYPWLVALLPARPADARPCSACRGGGSIHTNISGRIFCGECGALGWAAAQPNVEAAKACKSL